MVEGVEEIEGQGWEEAGNLWVTLGYVPFVRPVAILPYVSTVANIWKHLYFKIRFSPDIQSTYGQHSLCITLKTFLEQLKGYRRRWCGGSSV